MYFSPLAMRELVAGLGPRTAAAVSALLPGPVTLVVANPERRYPLACREDPERLGVRLLAGPLAGAMCPIFQTSANLSGEPAPARFDDVPEAILAGADLAIDGGELTGLPSTVVDIAAIEADGAWRILREGAVSEGDLASALASVGLDLAPPAQQPGPPVKGRRTQAARGVVVLVRLEEEFLRVDGHLEGEAAAQAGDVDPLLVVGGGVDVRPADRGAERDPVAVGVLVAAGVVAARAGSARSAGSARGRAGSS